MITPEYCQAMSRYNSWQNNSLKSHVDVMAEADLRADRGVFFRSITETLNHILWADLLWVARFYGGADSGFEAKDHTAVTSTKEEWDRLRSVTDRRIIEWADQLKPVDLAQTVSWYSASKDRDISKSLSMCVVHFFNHQTHHRGQVHAMLTGMGRKTMDTDLVFMPDD